MRKRMRVAKLVAAVAAVAGLSASMVLARVTYAGHSKHTIKPLAIPQPLYAGYGRTCLPPASSPRRPRRPTRRRLPPEVRRSARFRSMGCEVIVAGATPREQRAIERLFSAREATFSRFRADSELNRVNGTAGRPTRVSTVFARVLRLALDAQRETGGIVDPRFGAHLEAAGYDRDFALLDGNAPASVTPPRPVEAVRLNGCTVLVPVGVRLDLNGVVK